MCARIGLRPVAFAEKREARPEVRLGAGPVGGAEHVSRERRSAPPHRTRLSPVGVGTTLVLLVTAACRLPEDGAQTEIPVVGSVDAAEACPRSPAQTRTRLLRLNQTSGYPCRVVAVPTGVELRPSPDGTRPDPRPSGGQLGDQVAVDSRGRFFTGARWQSQVLVWNDRGEYLGTIGGEGSGPGEFSRAPSAILVGPGDTVHVREGARWHAFDPEGRPVRTFPLPGRVPRSTIHLTEDHEMLFTEPVAGGDLQAVLHFADASGRYLRSRGRVRITPSAYPARGSPYGQSAYSDGSVWIAPAPGSGRGYFLERLDTTGALVQEIQRETPWLPLDGYSDPELQSTMPDFKLLNVDGEGLLWVSVAVRDPRWTPSEPGEHPDAREGRQFDFRLEVFDPEAGEIVAAVRLDAPSASEPPPLYAVGRGTRKTYGYSVDSLGLATLRFFELHLVRNGGERSP